MCGRLIQSTTGDRLAERFHLPTILALTPRYDVAPSQSILAIRVTELGQREAVALRWGLAPAWSLEPRTVLSTYRKEAVIFL